MEELQKGLFVKKFTAIPFYVAVIKNLPYRKASDKGGGKTIYLPGDMQPYVPGGFLLIPEPLPGTYHMHAGSGYGIHIP